MLWLLKRRDRAEVPWYDEMDGLVVRALTEEDARKVAENHKGDECSRIWRDPAYSTCEAIVPEGQVTLVLRSMNWG